MGASLLALAKSIYYSYPETAAITELCPKEASRTSIQRRAKGMA